MTMHSVTLRFIRNKVTQSSDDVLRITPSDEPGSFVVKFTPATTHAVGDCQQKVSWNRDQVYDYVANLLTLLTFDSDPFASVQLDLPLAPSLLFDISFLPERIPYVLRFLYTTLTNPWPKPVKPVEPVVTNPVVMNPEEYDDMPPLVPCEDEAPPHCRSSRRRCNARHTFYDDYGNAYRKF